MGKIKRGRNKPNKNKPTGSSKGEDEEIHEMTSEITPSEVSIQAAKEHLQSPNLEDKLCGLQTLATLLESKTYETTLMKQSVVRVAAPLLVDPNPNVRNATAGTLRNFSALGLDACEYLVSQDIMTPLIEFFKKYADNWIPKKTNTGKLDEDADTFLHCVHLLWNLGESSGISVKYFNESNLMSILTRCLDIEAFGNEMVAAILHCLFVITEDNPKAIESLKILGEEPIKIFFSLEGETPIHLLLRILTAGIILNLQTENLKALPVDTFNRIISAVSATMSMDLRVCCNKLSSVLPLKNTKTDAASHKQNKSIENEVENVKKIIDAQQIAIEIMTNLCSCEGQEDDMMETDNVSDQDSDMEDENFTDCTNNGTDTSYSIEKLPVEMVEYITNFNLVDKIMKASHLPAENVLQILEESEEGQNIYMRLCVLQSRSLLCLNNLITNLPIEMLGGPEEIYKLFIDTAKRIFRNPVPYVLEDIMESASAVMRASLDRIKCKSQESNGTTVSNALIAELSLNDITFILEGITECPYLEIRANLTRMVGNLGLILTQKPENYSCGILINICEFLLDRLFKETECWLLAEVIDTIMDLFSEDETDLLAKQMNLVDKLNVIKPTFKNKVRQQKKTLGDHTAIVSTVVTNLPRFIDYKKKRILRLK